MAERGKRRSSSPGNQKDKKRVKLSSSEVRELSRDKLVSKWKEQDNYVDHLLSRLEASGADEVSRLRESESRLQLQNQECTRRENVLNMRLATKQQEMQDLLSQVHDLKQAQSTESSQLHQMMVDPAVNVVFSRMKSQLGDYKDKLEQAQSDLSAWKFTPDSVTGKKLMAKCRSLLQENQELGRQISQGRVAQLEAEVALHKKCNMEIKAAQDELNEFILQLDEEVESMQSAILHLHQQLLSLPPSPLPPPHPHHSSGEGDRERTSERGAERTSGKAVNGPLPPPSSSSSSSSGKGSSSKSRSHGST